MTVFILDVYWIIVMMIGFIMFIKSRVIGPSEARDCVYLGCLLDLFPWVIIGFIVMMIRFIILAE